ncbi:MAG: aldolase [Robiginitomaculum sp.]|nr:MAG: aldolase [Robiginitomaculum sp.]
MSSFDEREGAFEKKFVLDAEQEFRVQARRNKILGIWVAGILGKTGDDIAAYALEVIKSDMEEAGDEDVFRKVKQDLIASGNEIPDVEIRERMTVLLTEARVQIVDEIK